MPARKDIVDHATGDGRAFRPVGTTSAGSPPAQSRTCTSMHNRRSPIPTVSKPYQNLNSLRPGNLPLSEKQTPQVIDKSKSRKNAMEPKEASWGLHTQEVTGSSPVTPTISFNDLEFRIHLAEGS